MADPIRSGDGLSRDYLAGEHEADAASSLLSDFLQDVI